MSTAKERIEERKRLDRIEGRRQSVIDDGQAEQRRLTAQRQERKKHERVILTELGTVNVIAGQIDSLRDCARNMMDALVDLPSRAPDYADDLHEALIRADEAAGSLLSSLSDMSEEIK